MSVALNANLLASARSKTLDSIGIVVRRSTRLCVWLKALRKAARSIVSFMLLRYRFVRTDTGRFSIRRLGQYPRLISGGRAATITQTGTDLSNPRFWRAAFRALSVAASGAAIRHPR